MKNLILDRYLDYVNNFLSVQCFAEYYSLTEDEALRAIEMGKELNDYGVQS